MKKSDALREIVDERDRRYEQRFQHIEKTQVDSVKAVESALAVTDKTESAFISHFSLLEQKIDSVVEQLQRTRGREAGSTATWGVIAIVMTLIFSAVAIVVAVIAR